MPDLPRMQDVYGLDPVAIASYPMYRGFAKLVGMEVLPTGDTIEEELATLRQAWDAHDFFFVHYKPTDTAGEDGDFDRKVQALERMDQAIPALLDMSPDVLIVTGDHSTPTVLAGHSWHPVPLLIHSKSIRRGYAEAFTERECARGGLGTIPATDIMTLALANARKLDKFGA
jgi:2,3-bisphosphoglycerate-independent phosphoglycerate mutase